MTTNIYKDEINQQLLRMPGNERIYSKRLIKLLNQKAFEYLESIGDIDRAIQNPKYLRDFWNQYGKNIILFSNRKNRIPFLIDFINEYSKNSLTERQISKIAQDINEYLNLIAGVQGNRDFFNRNDAIRYSRFIDEFIQNPNGILDFFINLNIPALQRGFQSYSQKQSMDLDSETIREANAMIAEEYRVIQCFLYNQPCTRQDITLDKINDWIEMGLDSLYEGILIQIGTIDEYETLNRLSEILYCLVYPCREGENIAKRAQSALLQEEWNAIIRAIQTLVLNQGLNPMTVTQREIFDLFQNREIMQQFLFAVLQIPIRKLEQGERPLFYVLERALNNYLYDLERQYPDSDELVLYLLNETSKRQFYKSVQRYIDDVYQEKPQVEYELLTPIERSEQEASHKPVYRGVPLFTDSQRPFTLMKRLLGRSPQKRRVTPSRRAQQLVEPELIEERVEVLDEVHPTLRGYHNRPIINYGKGVYGVDIPVAIPISRYGKSAGHGAIADRADIAIVDAPFTWYFIEPGSKLYLFAEKVLVVEFKTQSLSAALIQLLLNRFQKLNIDLDDAMTFLNSIIATIPDVDYAPTSTNYVNFQNFVRHVLRYLSQSRIDVRMIGDDKLIMNEILTSPVYTDITNGLKDYKLDLIFKDQLSWMFNRLLGYQVVLFTNIDEALDTRPRTESFNAIFDTEYVSKSGKNNRLKSQK